MSLLQPACVQSGKGNTGMPDCFFDIKRISGVILAPDTAEITEANAADVDTFLTFLQGKTILDDRSARWFPIFHTANFEDQSTEATIYTQPYGVTEKVDDGKYTFLFSVREGGLCRHNQLREFEGETYRIFLCDERGKLFGTKNSSGNGIGFTGKIEVLKAKFPTATEPAMYQYRITLDNPAELNSRSKAFVVDSDNEINWVNDLSGCQEIEIYKIAEAAGVVTAGVRLRCSKKNLYSLYDDEFASATLWNAVNASSGATITITGVTKDATNQGWDIAMTYHGDAILSLDGPATLAAASIGSASAGGFEAVDPLSFTLPAL